MRKPGSAPVVKDEWAIGQTEHEGRPMLVRVNTGLKPVAGQPPFKHRVGVTFVLLAPDENGFPQGEEAERLNEFEDALLPALGATGQSHLALVISTSGYREFVLYTVSPDAAAAAVEGLCARFTSNEIQSCVEPDEVWELYRMFAG